MTAKTEKTHSLSVIYAFFHYIDNWISKPGKANLTETETYLAKDFNIASNGKIVARSAEEYQTRMERFKSKYSRFEISEPLEEPIASGNQIVLHYYVTLTTHSGEQKTVHIMAMATIENDKIARWIQVANETETGTWDK